MSVPLAGSGESPIWKSIGTRLPRVPYQFPDAVSPAFDLFQQVLKGVPIAVIPFGRNLSGNLDQHALVDCFEFREPRLEIV